MKNFIISFIFFTSVLLAVDCCTESGHGVSTAVISSKRSRESFPYFNASSYLEKEAWKETHTGCVSPNVFVRIETAFPNQNNNSYSGLPNQPRGYVRFDIETITYECSIPICDLNTSVMINGVCTPFRTCNDGYRDVTAIFTNDDVVPAEQCYENCLLDSSCADSYALYPELIQTLRNCCVLDKTPPPPPPHPDQNGSDDSNGSGSNGSGSDGSGSNGSGSDGSGSDDNNGSDGSSPDQNGSEDYGAILSPVGNTLESVLASYGLVNIPFTASGSCSGELRQTFSLLGHSYILDLNDEFTPVYSFLSTIKAIFLFITAFGAVSIVLRGE